MIYDVRDTHTLWITLLSVLVVVLLRLVIDNDMH